MSKLSKLQLRLYPKLNTPAKIQTFLNGLSANYERGGETCKSPAAVLERATAHCMEGAMLAASILRFHGHQPIVVDLRAKRPDDDHILAIYIVGGYFGAITKSNHAVLRYRDPIYKNVRELALSYFHEYFDDKGIKNLREYSEIVNLSRFDKLEWEISKRDLWEIPKAVDDAKHVKFVSKAQEKLLRKADEVEIEAGKLLEWSRMGKRRF